MNADANCWSENVWIVLHPDSDTTVRGGFADSLDAVAWIDEQRAHETDATRLAYLQACVVAPYDPDRTT